MTLKKSLFNKGLIAINLKRWWWTSALYGLFLFFILPFNHLFKDVSANNDWAKQSIQQSLDIFSGSNPQAIFICTIPIVLAALIFHYLHNGRAAAVIHSLPFTRNALFINQAVSGLILLLLPVIATGLALIIINLTSHLKEYYSIFNILKWIGLTSLFNILLYSISLFVGMFTGNAIAHIAFTYILQVLPTGLAILVDENLRHLLHGYATLNATATGSLKYDFPLIMFLDHRGNELLTTGVIITYLFVAVIFFAASAFVHKFRHAETAGDVVAFSAMRPVFKYGVTVCATLLVGAYFSSISDGSLYVIVIGYVIGSLLGYYIAEALIQKNLNIWASYKGFLWYASVILLLILSITTDATGFIHRIPAPEDIEKVYFGSGIYEWLHPGQVRTNEQPIKYENNFYKHKDNINNIILLHKELIRNPKNNNGVTHYIIYTLKNGDNLIRRYIFNEEQYSALLKPIYESMEYKQSKFPVITQKPDEIKMIEITDDRSPKKPAVLTSPEEIKEFVNRLKQDVINTTFEQLTNNFQDSVYIRITDTNDKSMNYNLRTNYKSVIGWLKDKGYYNKIMLLPEEIEYVELEYPQQFADSANNSGQFERKRVIVKERRVIKELLNYNSRSNFTKGKFIYVNFYGQVGSTTFQFNRPLSIDIQASDELRSYIEQLII